jgi:hypothetical protein
MILLILELAPFLQLPQVQLGDIALPSDRSGQEPEESPVPRLLDGRVAGHPALDHEILPGRASLPARC